MRLNEDDIEHVLTQKGVEQPKVKDIMTEIKRLEDEEAEAVLSCCCNSQEEENGACCK